MKFHSPKAINLLSSSINVLHSQIQIGLESNCAYTLRNYKALKVFCAIPVTHQLQLEEKTCSHLKTNRFKMCALKFVASNLFGCSPYISSEICTSLFILSVQKLTRFSEKREDILFKASCWYKYENGLNSDSNFQTYVLQWILNGRPISSSWLIYFVEFLSKKDWSLLWSVKLYCNWV